MVTRSSEKPWYTPGIATFLSSDVSRLLGTSQQLFARDIHTIEHRLATEGESFLTKTLPTFGKAIDLALQGHVPLRTTSFSKRGRTALPKFLSALLRRVFLDDGWVRDDPCIMSIRLLRQITLWCKKIKKGYNDESLQKAIKDFKEVDDALPSSIADFPSNVSGLLGLARGIVESIFANCGDIDSALPGHGPGAVAGGEGVVGKRALGTSYSSLEQVFRPIPWFFSLRDAAESPQRIFDRPKKLHGLSKIAFVEKDSSGPRTIGLEPAEYMWCQQAIKKWMYHHIEARSLASGRINFTNQEVNRELARDWQRYDTLDMSKASDRNSFALVEALFSGTKLWPYLQASRTPGTVLPNGEVLMYKKFAPMGSAVCFPVQAVVYYSLACAVQHQLGKPLLLACLDTYVYGDDLILPHGFFPEVNSAFEKVGLKFNDSKCCTEGRFRESCGLDAYDGCVVTPVRMKVVSVDTPNDLVAIVQHANALMDNNYWATALELRRLCVTEFLMGSKITIPLSHRRDLPILTWRTAPWEIETVNYRVNKDTGLTSILGWSYKPTKLVSNSELEMKHLRESLCHGGPVGVLKNTEHTSCWERFFTMKYRGDLVRQKFVVQSREGKGSELPRLGEGVISFFQWGSSTPL